MNTKLLFEALIKFFLGIILVGLLLFIPACSFKFYHGWLLIGLLFIPMLITGVIMFFKSPNLLKSRLDVKEKEKEQKLVVKLSGLMFLIGFIIAGLNYRFNWMKLPNIIVIISSIIFLFSYVLYVIVLSQNAFLSRTIKVESKQKLIDKGLYKIVRHPMYFATIFLFLSMPLILNSPISFVVFLSYPFIIVKRIKNEEEILEKELVEYKEYKKKVKYKLIPYIW